MTCTSRIFISAMVALVAIAGYFHSGNARLSRSTSVPVTSPAKTVPNSPIVTAKKRSLPADPVFISQAISGGSLKVSNGTNRDAYVKLIEPTFRILVGTLYVKANTTLTLNQIPDGTYQVLFVLGEGWNPNTRSFSKNKSFSKFDKSLNFTTTPLVNGIEYSVLRSR
ncbi:MAG: hypothetical protein HC773_30430 [Scytonema sp. CRU_2_7]|nr:hypothetical protein [Scytonema sp. CRU_2_7]